MVLGSGESTVTVLSSAFYIFVTFFNIWVGGDWLNSFACFFIQFVATFFLNVSSIAVVLEYKSHSATFYLIS